MTITVLPPPADPVRTAPGRRRRAAAGAAVAVALAGGLAGAGWWSVHPSVFPDAPTYGFVGTSPRPGETLYVAITAPGEGDGGTARIRSLRPTGVSDTAGTRVGFVVCTLPPNAPGPGDLAMGSTVGLAALREFCAGLAPAVGAELALGPASRQQVLVALTPTRPGRYRYRGVEITYTHGWQRGTQVTGPEGGLDARPPADRA